MTKQERDEALIREVRNNLCHSIDSVGGFEHTLICFIRDQMRELRDEIYHDMSRLENAIGEELIEMEKSLKQ